MRAAVLLVLLAIGCAAPTLPPREPRCAEALVRGGIEPDRAVVACAGRR